MKFNEYIKMKNFSQQNFGGLASAVKAVKSVPKKFKIFKENYKTASKLDKQAKEALNKSNAALSESAMHSDQYIKLHNTNNNSKLVKSLVNNPEAVAIMDKANKARNVYKTELANARNLQDQATAVGGRFFRFLNPTRSFSQNKGEFMKFDEYIKMKNFSEQQNFAAIPGFMKNAGTRAWDFLKKVPETVKTKATGILKPGDKLRAEGFNDMYAADLVKSGFGKLAKSNKGPANAAELAERGFNKWSSGVGKNVRAQDAITLSAIGAGGAAAAAKKIWGKKTLDGIEGAFQKVGSKFTNGKNSILTTGKTAAENQAALGKKIVAGAGAGTALAGGTVFALAGSGNMDPGKYYIFDDQTGKVLGSSSGYASKAEAMADRNARFQGGRINLGSTLAAKMSA